MLLEVSTGVVDSKRDPGAFVFTPAGRRLVPSSRHRWWLSPSKSFKQPQIYHITARDPVGNRAEICCVARVMLHNDA